MATSGWVGIDLDGTLAHYTEWEGPGNIGAPIPAMVAVVHELLAADVGVRIFTARVYCPENADPWPAQRARELIEAWCLEHIGVVLPITCTKDFGMIELWDDRVVCVERNTGKILGRNQ